jgi:TRAP-type C4-dicarboxylate transport system substrate-binding protein
MGHRSSNRLGTRLGRRGTPGAAMLLLLILWATASFASEAVLVHDISAPHPRLKYFEAMAADVAKRSGGAQTVAINPGGKILYPAKASLDAVMSGKAHLALINTSHLETIDPRIGLINQPFTISDEIMGRQGVAEGVIDFIQGYLQPRNLKILGLMRGADTLFIFKKLQVRRPEDLKGAKIRVAGPGVFQEMVRSFAAEPLVIPFIEISSAMERGTVDGVLTSPGGWFTQFGLKAPNGSLVPGLIFMTYSVVADKAWLDRLPAGQRESLIQSVRAGVTEKWGEMERDDREIISTFVAQGASFWSAPAAEMAPWKERVAGMRRAFAETYPDVVRKFDATLQSSGR